MGHLGRYLCQRLRGLGHLCEGPTLASNFLYLKTDHFLKHIWLIVFMKMEYNEIAYT